ncbi:histidine kinase [Seonamhaeicola algicola]|uniref:histidine kinase n=1 Tax=Seonamhaeicola algicola TaxID=1719036 RepID=A0A5C7B3J6_9FLAO|nr:ATP-binding protein [Seonamhaeicola algicola]TXE15017.1 histidine kinase [Seonamhaeicola algicola]
MDEKEIQSFLITSSVVLVSLVVTMIFLFLIFQKRKNKLLIEQKEAERHFEKEISKAQIEIREQILRNISWELHDNIGQLLTLAKIQVQSHTGLDDVKETLNISLKELRSLAKLVHPDILKHKLLTEIIALEIERFNRLNVIKAKLKVIGEPVKLNAKKELIFFRILQEFFSNTIKHAKASKLYVELNYGAKDLTIMVEDNGQGFETNEQACSGIGLSNIKSRIKLINAKADFVSKPNEGTKLTITYKY